MDSPIRELLRSSDFLRLWLVGTFANAMRWLELLETDRDNIAAGSTGR